MDGFISTREFSFSEELQSKLMKKDFSTYDYWLNFNENDNCIEFILDDNTLNLKFISIGLTGDSSKYIMKYQYIYDYSKPNSSQNIVCRSTENYLICSMSNEMKYEGRIQPTDYSIFQWKRVDRVPIVERQANNRILGYTYAQHWLRGFSLVNNFAVVSFAQNSIIKIKVDILELEVSAVKV